jgi:ubiquinone/menaquinone biosynthesis C-methylase UbiE
VKQDKLSNHYTGNIAGEYEQSRKKGQKWHNEDAAMARLLSSLPDGLKIIDIPVGTGRFFELYANKKHIVEGADISKDMLHEAQNHPYAEKIEHTLSEANIFDLSYPDSSFDLAICIRFMNLVNSKEVHQALEQLARVSKKHIIVGIRDLVPISNIKIHTPSGLKMYARQCLSRLTKQAKGKIAFHTKSTVESIFNDIGVKIIKKECIEHRDDGTDYFIYLLEKQ